MPQYLVAIYLRRLRPVCRNRSDYRGDPRAQRRNDCCQREESSPAAFPRPAAQDAAGAVQWQGGRHRRAVHRDQGAHPRSFDTGSRRSGRGARVGTQGCRRLPGAGGGAPDSFQAGPEGSKGIVWPPRLRNMHRSDYRMNEPAQGSAAGSHQRTRKREDQ